MLFILIPFKEYWSYVIKNFPVLERNVLSLAQINHHLFYIFNVISGFVITQVVSALHLN